MSEPATDNAIESYRIDPERCTPAGVLGLIARIEVEKARALAIDHARKLAIGVSTELRERIAALEQALRDEWHRWNSMNGSRTQGDGSQIVRQALNTLGALLSKGSKDGEARGTDG